MSDEKNNYSFETAFDGEQAEVQEAKVSGHSSHFAGVNAYKP